MDPIQEAIEYIESHKPGDDFSYTKVAAQFSVKRKLVTTFNVLATPIANPVSSKL
ncbi:uncharacterized protein SETTUDRAFT_27945 [Exserohilum turcica Et28A]|uniref:HTH psq-type domain-containing protein n=1 Tax=Exserohilum turcicum (strain 28A) TaxID=671987 RepID=R0KFB7_EXST2|nr:uncharacterized protein SETTUDRAFT_27945 [Exserohilum turcica Et28A]EOA88009.1 hypothetical protein SETTUDRAFT_27945 [Exserohilum turcica Et28A]